MHIVHFVNQFSSNYMPDESPFERINSIEEGMFLSCSLRDHFYWKLASKMLKATHNREGHLLMIHFILYGCKVAELHSNNKTIMLSKGRIE